MSDDNDDENSIDKALGIGPIVTTINSAETTIATIVDNALNDSAKEDFMYARANLREVLENTNDAAIKLATVADQSQNPRAYEVLAKLMDTMINASDKLLELHKKIRDVGQIDEPQTHKSITNNLFVGSTADLQQVLANIKR
jgi:hypothetical protein